MKVFLSYSHKDSEIAEKIAKELSKFDLVVWNAETEILPGDNWAEKVSNALKDSDAMVVLITPDSLESRTVQREIEYALGNKSYDNRLIPVLVGSEESVPEKSIPWILQKLQTIRLSKSDQFNIQVNQINNAIRGNIKIK
ncbi:MAG: toll/interleukin-1 receptor domain-containing protein [Pyrinomonadaceae bacterium]|nr:toll/interleukin-1 receptor domain-containing protein [Pyrinomonadaceae bacterium]